jgi:hypothetical protein
MYDTLRDALCMPLYFSWRRRCGVWLVVLFACRFTCFALAKALTLMLCSLGLQHIGLQLGLQHDFDVVLARFRSFKCRRL